MGLLRLSLTEGGWGAKSSQKGGLRENVPFCSPPPFPVINDRAFTRFYMLLKRRSWDMFHVNTRV